MGHRHTWSCQDLHRAFKATIDSWKTWLATAVGETYHNPDEIAELIRAHLKLLLDLTEPVLAAINDPGARLGDVARLPLILRSPDRFLQGLSAKVNKISKAT